jgi:hypothetical protein
VKFRCDRDALSEALQTVQRGVSSRPGIPALTGVLIEASPEGALTLTTTDLEVSARLSIDVQVGEPGISLVPARLLADTVKSLSDAPVEFETDQSQAGSGARRTRVPFGCCRPRTSRRCSHRRGRGSWRRHPGSRRRSDRWPGRHRATRPGPC